MAGEMRELAADGAPQVPTPEYRASIDAGDLDGLVFTSWPTMMRETPDGRFTHVLYGSDDKNVSWLSLWTAPEVRSSGITC